MVDFKDEPTKEARKMLNILEDRTEDAHNTLLSELKKKNDYIRTIETQLNSAKQELQIKNLQFAQCNMVIKQLQEQIEIIKNNSYDQDAKLRENIQNLVEEKNRLRTEFDEERSKLTELLHKTVSDEKKELENKLLEKDKEVKLLEEKYFEDRALLMQELEVYKKGGKR